MEADGHHLSRGYHWSAPFDVSHFYCFDNVRSTRIKQPITVCAQSHAWAGPLTPNQFRNVRLVIADSVIIWPPSLGIIGDNSAIESQILEVHCCRPVIRAKWHAQQ
jgi:hypothetical protein